MEGSTIRVNGEDYTIKGLKSDSRAHSLLGRATRVYHAVDSKGKEVIIKDVWMDCSRPKEHEIQERIIRELKEAGLTTSLSLFFTHRVGLNVLQEGGERKEDSTEEMCKSSSGEVLNFTTSRGFFTRHPEQKKITANYSIGSLTSHNTKASARPPTGPEPHFSGIKHRVHYRLVIEEVAVPICDLHSAEQCMFVLYMTSCCESVSFDDKPF